MLYIDPGSNRPFMPELEVGALTARSYIQGDINFMAYEIGLP